MKKKIVMMIMAVTLCASLLCACGEDKTAESASETEEAVEEEEESVDEEPAEETDEAADEETADADSESDGSFSLLDVDESMVDVGAYGTSDDGTELVFTMFTGPDGNKYVSLFGFDNNSENGDVICGQYNSSTETDDEGDEWTYFDVEDAYTGNHFNLGVCERPATEEIVFFDKDGNVVTGKFLSAGDTINYMGSAAALLDQ